MKNKKYLILILILIIIFSSIYLFSKFLDTISVIEEKELYAQIIIGDRVGIDVNGSALMFGMIPPGKSTAQRTIEIKNQYNQNIKVKTFVKGDIKDFLIVSDNNFILLPNQTKKIGFTVQAPIDSEYGTYSGKVIIKIVSPNIK